MLLAIHITPKAGQPMTTLAEVEAVVGRGLAGDRYYEKAGAFSKNPGTGREVTLIEAEALASLKAEYGIDLAANLTRRNLLTQGVPLNHLVGREFRIGYVVLRGMRLCEPCRRVESLSGTACRKGLVHRGGLRADLVQGGILRVGAKIEW